MVLVEDILLRAAAGVLVCLGLYVIIHRSAAAAWYGVVGWTRQRQETEGVPSVAPNRKVEDFKTQLQR